MSRRASNDDGIAVAGITAEEMRRLEAWARIHEDAATAALVAKVARLEADRAALAAVLRAMVESPLVPSAQQWAHAGSVLARLDAGEGAARGERGGEG